MSAAPWPPFAVPDHPSIQAYPKYHRGQLTGIARCARKPCSTTANFHDVLSCPIPLLRLLTRSRASTDGRRCCRVIFCAVKSWHTPYLEQHRPLNDAANDISIARLGMCTHLNRSAGQSQFSG